VTEETTQTHFLGGDQGVILGAYGSRIAAIKNGNIFWQRKWEWRKKGTIEQQGWVQPQTRAERDPSQCSEGDWIGKGKKKKYFVQKNMGRPAGSGLKIWGCEIQKRRWW